MNEGKMSVCEKCGGYVDSQFNECTCIPNDTGTVADVKAVIMCKDWKDLSEWAWGVIANAGVSLGDWKSMSKDWQETAPKWREEYHRLLNADKERKADVKCCNGTGSVAEVGIKGHCRDLKNKDECGFLGNCIEQDIKTGKCKEVAEAQGETASEKVLMSEMQTGSHLDKKAEAQGERAEAKVELTDKEHHFLVDLTAISKLSENEYKIAKNMIQEIIYARLTAYKAKVIAVINKIDIFKMEGYQARAVGTLASEILYEITKAVNEL